MNKALYYTYLTKAAEVEIARPHKSMMGEARVLPKARKNSDWWDRQTPKAQRKYKQDHPKSEKHESAKQKAAHEAQELNDAKAEQKNNKDWDKQAEEQHQPQEHKAIPVEPHKANVHLKHFNYDPNSKESLEARRKYEADRQAEADKYHKINKSAKYIGPDKGLAFMMREGKVMPSKEKQKEMTKKEVAQAKEDYAEWMKNYGHLSPDELTDVANKYYNQYPDRARQDRVTPDPSIKDDYPDLDEAGEEETDAEEEKSQAEHSKTAKNDKIITLFDKSYHNNPLDGMPAKKRDAAIAKAIEKIAPNFKADTNEIIGNTYEFLNSSQIALLEDAAKDAIQSNLTKVSKKTEKELAERRKKLLKVVFIAIATAAALATGGAGLGALVLHHAMLISGHEGKTHEVIWNCLRGKCADGKDDPHFDPHDDAVEKIIKSLKRQLTDSTDDDQSEQIEEIIEQLEKQQYKHRLDHDDEDEPIKATRKRKTATRKPAARKKKN